MTTSTRRSIVVAVLALAWAGAQVAHAAAPAAVCAAAKRKAAAKKASGKLSCASKAAAKGTAIASSCLASVETKFAAAYAKADSKGGCAIMGNAASVETTVDGCVGAVQTALAVPGGTLPKSGCLAAKLKAAGKKVSGKVSCSAKAVLKGAAVDPNCLTKAETKFSTSMTKAEAKTNCVQTGDAASTETAVDQCLTDIEGAEPAPTTTTTSTSSTSTSSTTSTSSSSTTSTSSSSTTTTSTSSTTSTTLVCNTESVAFSGITAQHNSTRASASPTPVPALSPLCWSNVLTSYAQAWANGCNFSHDPALGTNGQGQNIFAEAVSVGFPTTTAQDAEPAWASEAADYDYPTNTCSGVCGHYTQIVWRDTSFVGCGITNCTTNSPFIGFPNPNWTLVVCNYAPPGNFIGEQPY